MSSDQHRVVVTGVGAVTPLGIGWEPSWQALRSGTNGIRPIKTFDVGPMPVTFAGEIDDMFAEPYLARPFSGKAEKSVQLGMIAAREALVQAGLVDDQDRQLDTRLAVIIGSAIGPWREIDNTITAFQRHWKSVRPTAVSKLLINAVASNISIYFGLKGSHSVTASACTSAASAITHAWLLIKTGIEQAVLCGGAESPVVPSYIGAWLNMHVLARHEDPSRACRPFDKQRSGLVFGDGAGMLVLESLALARKRGAKILGEITAFGASSDTHHLTMPSQEGQVAALRQCLSYAGVRPEQVDYVNAHGTSTEANDRVEANSLFEVFGARGTSLPINSTKSMIGHSLGACGAIELLAVISSIRDQFVHPTRNCDQPDPELGLDFVPQQGRPHSVQIAISNSFAFGGNNVVIMCRKFKDD